MAKREILRYPDPRLRTKAAPISAVDDSIRALAADLLETMYAAPGIGLAATQVNVHKRLVVIDVSEQQDQALCLVNPVLAACEGSQDTEEGCLSVPGVFDTVVRAAKVRLRALDLRGQTLELEAEGLLAVCIQHEIDHLDGKLFVDYLSSLKRSRLSKKLEKTRRYAL